MKPIALPTGIAASIVLALSFAACVGTDNVASEPRKSAARTVATSSAARVRRSRTRRAAADDARRPAPPAVDVPVAADVSDRPSDPMDHVLSGRVVDSRGNPVAGAKVALVSCSLPRDVVLELSDIEVGNEFRVVYPHTDSEAVTDTAGAFAVRYRGDGDRTLRVSRGATPEVFVDEPSDRCVLRLPDERPKLAVHVVRADDGTPVLGARVSVDQGELGALRGWWCCVKPIGSATTDADGRCRIDDGLAVGPAQVVVGANDYAYWVQDAVEIPDGGASIEVRLSVGNVVEGRVVNDETGATISGARVGGGATSDGAGRFRAEHFDGDRIHAWTIEPWGYETAGSRSGDAPVVVRDGVADDVTIRVVRPAAFTLRCVDPSGAPIPGAVVATSCGSAAETDAQGRARIEGAELVREGVCVVFYRDGVVVHRCTLPPLGPGETRDLGDIRLP